jgi:3',5'-cyclic AMP phosphodiesterase CpdA
MDPTGALEVYDKQLQWLETTLKQAHERSPSHIFVLGHHPWFLYHEEETSEDLSGESPYPHEWGTRAYGFGDAYFHIPRERRRIVLALFQRYHVTAAFAGHFHQNWTTRASFGMDMIVTSSLSLVFASTGIPATFAEPRTRGMRLVQVSTTPGHFTHEFISLNEQEDVEEKE